MKAKHLGLALTVVVCWSLSFVAVKLGLRDMPPLALSAARMMLTSLPWVFMLPRPPVPLHRLALYGIFTFTLYLGLLAIAIHLGAPAGLASVMMQLHIFVTAVLAALFLSERLTPYQIIGALISFGGLGFVALHAIPGSKDGLSVLSLFLLLLAATARGTANIISKRLGNVDTISLIAWGSLFAWPPLLLASLALEGPQLVWHSVLTISLEGAGSLLFMAYLGTFLAFALWSKLLYLYPTHQVTPFTLLVPALTILLSALILDEPLLPWKLGATALILAGAVVALFGRQIAQCFKKGLHDPRRSGS